MNIFHMQTIKITTSQNIDIDYEVAGLGERIVARLIDLAIFFLIFFLGMFIGSIANWFAQLRVSVPSSSYIIYACAFCVLRLDLRDIHERAKCRQTSHEDKSDQPGWRTATYGPIFYEVVVPDS